MKLSLFTKVGPIEFINKNKFLDQVKKEVYSNDFVVVEFAYWTTNYKFSLAQSTNEFPSESMTKIGRIDMKLIDPSGIYPLFNEFLMEQIKEDQIKTFKYGQIIKSVGKYATDLYCKIGRNYPNVIVRVSPRKWLLTNPKDWKICFTYDKTKCAIVNVRPTNMLLLNVEREPDISLIPSSLFKRYSEEFRK